MKVFDSIRLLERSLDVRLQKQNQLSANIANVDTPGYVPKTVDFEASMDAFLSSDAGMDGSDENHMSVSGMAGRQSGGRNSMVFVDDLMASATLDENAVDLDHTMAQLAENGVQFQAVTKAVSKKLAILRYVANDGVG
ncbi:MAG: flagellar basal body rod protein FlgB [Deltaproteobacteria bacterium]|nr:flagellar basal body rod protein FlgB [Deltaproteobacteria bacterium]